MGEELRERPARIAISHRWDSVTEPFTGDGVADLILAEIAAAGFVVVEAGTLGRLRDVANHAMREKVVGHLPMTDPLRLALDTMRLEDWGDDGR